MESKYPNLRTFKKKLQFYQSIEDLHRKILKIILLITHNGWFYCFCHKYHGCQLDYNQGWKLCPLCQILIYKKRSLEAFQWMYYSSRDRYTGQKNETSLKDQIEFTTDIKRRNKKKKYFDFFLLSNQFSFCFSFSLPLLKKCKYIQ